MHINKEFAYSERDTGFILSGFQAGYFLTQGLGGLLSDKFGSKYILAFSTFVWSFGELLTALTASQFMLLFSSRVLSGCGAGLAFPSCQSFIAQWLPDSEKHVVVALTMIVTYAGSIFPCALGPSLINLMSWKFWSVSLAFVGFAWLVPWISLSSVSPLTSRWLPKTERESVYEFYKIEDKIEERTEKESIFPIILKLFKTKAMWGIILVQFTNSIAFKTFTFYMPTFLESKHDYSKDDSSHLTIWIYVLQLSFAILGTWINTLNMSIMRKRVGFQLFSMFGSAFLLLLVVWIDSRASIPFLFLSVGLYSFSSFGVQMSHVDLSGKYAGMIYGFGAAASNLAGFIGTSLTGITIEKYKNWNILFAICIASYSVGGFLWIFMCQTRKIKLGY